MTQISTAKAGMTICPRCRSEWGGLKTAHCTSCHQTFTTVGAFDKHRDGSHADDTRHCVDPESVGLISAGRAYPCWGFSITNLFTYQEAMWDARGEGKPEPRLDVVRMPGLYIEVDGREVLFVSDVECAPTVPVVVIPWRERTRRKVKQAIRKRARSVETNRSCPSC